MGAGLDDGVVLRVLVVLDGPGTRAIVRGRGGGLVYHSFYKEEEMAERPEEALRSWLDGLWPVMTSFVILSAYQAD